ncbi:hypothetical protein NXV77_23280 [Parabacteroides faecis]|nr:hypothetical protein [Parabacteroides faecis]MCS2893926.1 hypothetical protein [Parabacteroides faecis]
MAQAEGGEGTVAVAVAIAIIAIAIALFREVGLYFGNSRTVVFGCSFPSQVSFYFDLFFKRLDQQLAFRRFVVVLCFIFIHYYLSAA